MKYAAAKSKPSFTAAAAPKPLTAGYIDLKAVMGMEPEVEIQQAKKKAPPAPAIDNSK
jgi:hypothetical protein